MNKVKYTDGYVKGLCTMISRGDILNKEILYKYLKHLDMHTEVEFVNAELNMLLNIDLENFNPEYYIIDFGSIKKYSPIDLILYSCVCNKDYSFYKKELFSNIIEMKDLDFSNINKVLEHSVSKGDLNLFNSLVNLKPNYNLVYSYLKTGEPLSILDNCLSIALCRLTINNKSISENYPKEILEYLISLKDINYNLLLSTKLILENFFEIKDIDIEINPNILEKLKDAVNTYNNTTII